MKENRDSILLISIAFLLCVFRVIVKDSVYLNDIMALFNLVAINYSMWCMFNDADRKLKERNKNSPLGKEILKRNQKFFKHIRIIFEIILFIICSLLYLLFVKNSTGNDILTIVALCFALESNYFSDKLAKFCFSKVGT